MPLLEVLQSVPILSFLPVVLLSLSVLLPGALAAELAAEMFTVGERDFRLPGLGSYLQTAAHQGDLHAIGLGVATLIGLIVALDQLVWRPLLAWAERFKLETVEGGHETRSWFRDLLARSRRVDLWVERVWTPLMERLDRRWQDAQASVVTAPAQGTPWGWRGRLLAAAGGAVLLYLSLRAGQRLTTVPPADRLAIAAGLGATLLRVSAALLIATAWTIPVGVAIDTRPRLANLLQPLAQVAASVPATALFPILLLALLHLPGCLNLAAVLLMLLGTQWYLLFNIIASASAIPQDLRDTAALLLAATLAMVLRVALLNRLIWLPLYRLAEARYRME